VIYAVIPLLVALVCLWLGRRMATALVLLAYLSIEGFLKLLSNYNRVVHIGFDVIVLSLAGLLVLQAVMEHRAHLDELPFTKLILVYALWMILQVLNPFSPGILQSIASFKIHLTMVPLYFIAATLFRNTEDIIKFMFGLTIIALVPYSMSLVQYALGPSSFLDLSPRFWSNISYFHEFRPFGTSAVPGGSSVFAYLIVPLSVALLALSGIRRGIKPIALLSILLAAGTFVVSGVRQVLLGCVLAVVAMAVLLMMRRSGRVAFIGALLALIGFGGYVGVTTFLRPMATEAVLRDPRAPEIWRQRDVTQRMLTLSHASVYRESRDNPIPTIWKRASKFPFGAGLGRTGSALGAFKEQVAVDVNSAAVQNEIGWADNFVADMIAEGGIPAVIMLLWILFGMTYQAFRLARQATDPVIIVTAAAMAGFYLSIIAMSWGSQPLLGNPITAFFWFFSGMVAAMRRIEQNESRQREQAEALDDAVDDRLAPSFR
jgi:hypothetical protein